MFGGRVFIDKVPENFSNTPAVYILSRPFNLKSVKPCDALKIYTTAMLKSAMICSNDVRRSIELINDSGLAFNIELSNDELICIKAFSYDSKTLNVLILIEYQEQYTLYAGRFKTYNQIQNYPVLMDLMREKKIDHLYIDATAIDIQDLNLKRNACFNIRGMLDSYPDYKFHMLIDDFGYEDLIFELANQGVVILLDPNSTEVFRCQQDLQLFCTDPSKARIILKNKLAKDTRKQFEEEKIISIVLSIDDSLQLSDDFKFVRFTNQSTYPDIYYITHLVAPKMLIDINGCKNIPISLIHLLSYKD